MNIEFKPRVVEPQKPKEETVILINGVECGCICRGDLSGKLIASIKIPEQREAKMYLSGTGVGDTQQEAVEDAMDELRAQAAAITKFLEAAQ